MKSNQKPVVILGAGAAGLGAAYRLMRRGMFQATVIERAGALGGNAGSFELAGMRVDYGSHRLHSSCAPEVLGDLKRMLGDGLLLRPRHGRIRLGGKWLHFPLKAAELASQLPKSLLAGIALDSFANLARQTAGGSQPDRGRSLARVLEAGVGKTVYREFYFPYVRKVWGVDPDSLDAGQAGRRLTAGSFPKKVRNMLSAFPGIRTTTSRYYYPRRGYGAISEAYAAEATRLGAKLKPFTSVASIETCNGRVKEVIAIGPAGDEVLNAKHVFSTIPIAQLARLVRPKPPDDLLQSADALKSRAMVLCYLVLKTDRFTEYDAHYFPDASIAITRLSEPKNYSLAGPPGYTVLCAEIPCSMVDPVWHSTDSGLAEIVTSALEKTELVIRVPIIEVVSRRLPQAYPICTNDYRSDFDRVDRWLGEIEGLITFGRQGLFASDNTHHVLAMAYAVERCLGDDGSFDKKRWAGYRRQFEKHVVDD